MMRQIRAQVNTVESAFMASIDATKLCFLVQLQSGGGFVQHELPAGGSTISCILGRIRNLLAILTTRRREK